jgi:hypothetical protein
VLTLQATIRATLAGKKHQEVNSGTLLAAVCRRLGPRQGYRTALASRTIQAALRRRLVGMRRKSKETACNKLEQLVKSSLARRSYSARRSASITLQAAIQRNRGHNRGVSQMEERRQEMSCQCLEALCRRLIAREGYRKGLAARTIQAALLRSKAAHGKRRSHLACASLERVVRALPPRRKWSQQQAAALKLQAVLRRRQEQDEGKQQMDESRKMFSLQSLQAFCRRALARRLYSKDLAARSLQAVVRSRLAAVDRQGERNGVATLERTCKASLASHKYTEKQACAMILQAFLRRLLGQQQGQSHMEESRKTSAAEMLNAVCRRSMGRERYRQALGVRTIQAALRRMRAGRAKMEAHAACSCLQRFVKGEFARRIHAEQHGCAVQLQAVLRRCKGHRCWAQCVGARSEESATESGLQRKLSKLPFVDCARVTHNRSNARQPVLSSPSCERP